MKKIILSGLVLLLFFACSKNDTNNSTPPTKSAGLLPLSVGNFWQYTKISYDSNNAAIDTSLDEFDIIGQITINGVTYYSEIWSTFPGNLGSFLVNLDSNTLEKYDSGVQYTFFKRTQSDSLNADSWADTVTSRCKGHNYLYAFTDTTNINGHNCLRNIVYVNDCTGFNFEQWVYYLQPGLGFVRVQHYLVKNSGTFYLQFSADLKSYHTN